MFNDKISQRNYPVRAGYCASYYLCENSHWHPRALVVPSAAAPNLSRDKDIPWLVSWAIASFTKYVSGEKAWSSAQNNGGKSCILLHLGLLFLLDYFISCSLKLKALPAMGLLSLCACHALFTGTWNQSVMKLVTDQQWPTGTWTLSFISQISLLSPPWAHSLPTGQG